MTTTPRALAWLLSLALPTSAWAGEATAFGRPLRGLQATPLADILADPRDGQEVRVEGKVQAVCQNKGCWLELAQGNRSVHVTFEAYSFFLPKDAGGREVVLEGRVKIRRPTAQEVEHLEHEGAGSSAASRVSIEASGVELGEKK